MADVKISALPLATTPLAGTEVLPIVQSATTDQVSVANLTAGRAVSAASLTLTTTPLAVGSGGTGLTSLTAGYIPFGAGTSAFGNDSNLFWDNSNTRLGIGTSSPTAILDIATASAVARLTSTTGTNGATFRTINTGGTSYFGRDNSTGSGFGAAYSTVVWGQGAYPMLFGTNDTERMRLDSVGNLGLGVTPGAWSSPFTKAFEIGTVGSIATTTNSLRFANNAYYGSLGWTYKNTAAAAHYDIIDNTHSWYNATSGTAGSSITFTQAMTLDASGNLGITQTSPAYKLDITAANNTIGAHFYTAAGQSGIRIETAGNDKAVVEQYTNGNGNWRIGPGITTAGAYEFNSVTASATRMLIDSSGNLLVGTQSGTGRLVVQQSDAGNPGARIYLSSSTFGDNGVMVTADRNTTNNSFYFISAYNNTAAAYKFRVADSGNVTNTNNSYGAISDISIKENIVDATPKLNDLLSVKVKNFNFVGDSTKQIGVIAQELEEVFPALVETSTQDGIKSVKYSVFTPMLIKAIQELAAKVQALEAKVA